MCVFFPYRYLEKLKRYVSNRARPEGDVETEVVLEGRTSRDANQNEEHDISNVDLDTDYDM